MGGIAGPKATKSRDGWGGSGGIGDGWLCRGCYWRGIEVAGATLARRVVDGTMQIGYETDLSVEDYTTRKAWWDASAPAFRTTHRAAAGLCRTGPTVASSRRTCRCDSAHSSACSC